MGDGHRRQWTFAAPDELPCVILESLALMFHVPVLALTLKNAQKPVKKVIIDFTASTTGISYIHFTKFSLDLRNQYLILKT